MRNPYEILGVSRSADEADIKKAFRRLAKTYHPDRNKDDAKAKDRFAEVNQAYEILGDAKKRAQFDRGAIDGEGKPRHTGFEGFAGAGGGGRGGGFGGFDFESMARAGRGTGGGGGGAEDIFSHLFGEAFRSAGAGRGGGAAAQKGDDVSAELTVTLEQIAGESKLRLALPTGREVDVVVPKGVADGQTIRLRGLGYPGVLGGEAGDALLTIRIAPDSRFRVEGTDLRIHVEVPLEDAILGGAIRVPTLTGAVEMKIPAMTSSGRTFRLRGKGLPTKDGGRGDLLAVVAVTLPAAADESLLDFARRRRAAQASS
ncbi:DnaJ C-terminal domain-containing protein [Methylobacterium oryzihabitans]|uniref:J domain-containing protein n=1 Tax=Methylobacterium oryzihabitans TaxID=2499852 RepID=A0A3S2VNU4_9HYPH|nr:DnaJ C-terminal domain-containing protein [Methylobacterium oryzihabitans]RVU17162.1 J domain-containing protein [Methylobacterium oryzihabitans]